MPENIAADANSRERTLTIRHVLTMQSGLQWDNEGEWKLAGSANWLAIILKRPMASNPGAHFNYQNPH